MTTIERRDVRAVRHPRRRKPSVPFTGGAVMVVSAIDMDGNYIVP